MSNDKKAYTIYFITLHKDNGLYARPLLKVHKAHTALWNKPILPGHQEYLAQLVPQAERVVNLNGDLHDAKVGLIQAHYNYFNPAKFQVPPSGKGKPPSGAELGPEIGIEGIVWTGWEPPQAKLLSTLNEKYGCQPLTVGPVHYALMENEFGGDHLLTVIRPYLAEEGALLVSDNKASAEGEMAAINGDAAYLQKPDAAAPFSGKFRSLVVPAHDMQLGLIHVNLFHTDSRELFEAPDSAFDYDRTYTLKMAEKEITVSPMILHDFQGVPTREGLNRIRGRYARTTPRTEANTLN
ncbi:MAG TPA: hypothetical protein VFR09_02100 [Alphaproteobacteria bacterium]|nr:hypothetical protein [Alphaproteobacteria bacterium]